MGILRNEVARQFIAVPDDSKAQIVYQWPDDNIRKGARAIVDADQMAVFISKGQVLGTLGPGQHKIDAIKQPTPIDAIAPRTEQKLMRDRSAPKLQAP